MLLKEFFVECWTVVCELAPWVILGAVFSGLLHYLLPANFVRKKFQGKRGIIQAVLWGVPLPLCSCGVIPAGIGLKKQGASNGSAIGFMISTPQTGVDSILVSAAMLGWPFAIFKMLAATVTGIVGGLMAEQVSSKDHSLPILGDQPTGGNKLKESWLLAIEIIRSIWKWLVLGVIISAAISVFVPDQVIESLAGWGPLPGMLIALLIGIPLYVCATASVPIASALILAGLQPGAALVFLMAGPATNLATISAIGSQFGKKVTAVYLATVILGSILFALLFDWLFNVNITEHAHEHQHQIPWWQILSAISLLGLIAFFIYERLSRKATGNNEVTGNSEVAADPTDKDSCCK